MSLEHARCRAGLLAVLSLPACGPGDVIPSPNTIDHSNIETGSVAEPTETADTADPIEHVPGSDYEPGDALFQDDAVSALSLELDESAWASLLDDPKSYVEATFSDGETTLAVGVRLKGWSSYQPLTGKPNFRVSFDHYVEGQRYDGLEAVDIINEAEDPAFMSEAIAYRLFREAGQPASRTGFAWLVVNGMDYGLFTLVEKKDDVLIARWWPDDESGSLYESSSNAWPCDLDDGGAPRCDCWEQDEVGEDDRAELEALCAVATDTSDDEWYETIRETVDWVEISRHMAMEILLDAYDHYAGYMGNVYLYHAPEASAWSLIPASMNSVFGSTRYSAGSCGAADRAPTDFNGGLLIRRCWDDEECTADLYEALDHAVDTLQGSDILTRIDAWSTLLEPYVAADPRAGYTTDAYWTQVSCIRDWLEARPAELAPWLPVECLGEGGELDVDGLGNLSTNGSCDREHPDAVAYAVQSLSGARVALGTAPDGVEAGDEVLLIALQADDRDAAGSYAFADVASVEDSALVLGTTPDLGLDGDLSDRKVVVQRVPHYTNVRVRAGGTLTAARWDGETGGVLAIRVTGTLTIEDGGAVSVSGLGYAGGPTGDSYNVDGYQGESLAGPGVGGASSAAGYNESNRAWAANLGGGGCNVGGGGGEHAGGATASESWNGVATAPQAGETYGSEDLSQLYFGSGGGGVVNLGGASGSGGAGGGILFVEAGSIVAEGTAALVARGEDATAWASGSWTYGAGGGAGGSLWIQSDTMSLAAGALVATGGEGWDAVTRPGGDGGAGRIRVDCVTVGGVPCSDESLDGLALPAAWLGSR